MRFTSRGLQLPQLVQTVIDANGSIANVTNAEALIETPETSVGIAPTKIISNSAEYVKEKLSDRDTAGVRKSQIKADAYAHDTAGRQPIADILTKIKKKPINGFRPLGNLCQRAEPNTVSFVVYPILPKMSR